MQAFVYASEETAKQLQNAGSIVTFVMKGLRCGEILMTLAGAKFGWHWKLII
jgi:hypothetical protein